MDIITAIGTILGTIAVLLAKDWRDGKPLFKKSSEPTETQSSLNSIESKLALMSGNHLEHVQTGINDINSKADQQLQALDKAIYILEDIKREVTKR